MKIIVNDKAYPLRGYTEPSEHTILGSPTALYYLCRGKDGSEFALYLPNINEYYPRVK